jgi:uncharacterized repeat protein (TIGR03803 family)
MKGKSGIFVIALLGASLALATPTLTTVAATGDRSNDFPIGGVTVDAAGNLYGITCNGGPDNLGTVYEVAAGTHALNVLASFDGSNGSHPLGSPVMDPAGNLYGTTTQGGPTGNGTVFEVAAGSNIVTTLAAFNHNNGNYPTATLISDAAGNLYGTTWEGGANSKGTVFELAAGSNAITTLASFNGTNGSSPWGGLVADAQGNLYGTTQVGVGIVAGSGTIFEIAADSQTITTLGAFNSTNLGGYPSASMIFDAAGNLYGTAFAAGGKGGVFEVAAGSHALTTLVAFNGANGQAPLGGLVADAAGNLYGTTLYGGPNGDGTIFKIDARTHALTTLVADASEPISTLVADSAGNLYGTMEGTGDVFELSNTGFVVPEPGSLSLLGIGALGLLSFRRRV